MNPRGLRSSVRLLGPYLALALALALGVAAIAAWQVREQRTAELAQGRAETQALAVALEAQARRTFEGFERALRLLAVAHGRGVGDLILAPLDESLAGSTEARVERVFNRFDRDGRLAASSDPEVRPGGVSIADRPYFAAARDGPARLVIGAPVVGRVSGRPLLPLAYRLERPDGGFDGVISVAVDLASMQRAIATVQGEGRARAGLADAGDRVLVRTGAPQDLAEAGAVPQRVPDVAGTDAIIARRPVAGTPFVAFAALPLDAVLAEHRGYRRTVLGYASLVIVLLGGAVALLAARSWAAAGRARSLKHRYDAARLQALTDPLTGLANREAFDDALARACEAARDAGRPFVLAFVDLDRFKRLNDTQGHEAGDRALRRVADTIAGCVRRSDVPARLGGDEFAILLQDTSMTDCLRLFAALRETLRLLAREEGWPIGFSAGVVAFASAPADPRAAVRIADQLMYEAKAGGRDATRFATWRDGGLEPVDPGLRRVA